VPRLPHAGEDQEVEPGIATEPQPMARKRPTAGLPEAPEPEAPQPEADA
jgi:hypothetical protein